MLSKHLEKRPRVLITTELAEVVYEPKLKNMAQVKFAN